MTKPCECRWYTRCKKLSGCKKTPFVEVAYVPYVTPGAKVQTGYRTTEHRREPDDMMGTAVAVAAVSLMIDSASVSDAPMASAAWACDAPAFESVSCDTGTSYDSGSSSGSWD